MEFEITLYSVLSFVAALVASVVSGEAWKHIRLKGGLPLALLTTSLTIWSLANAFEYAAVGIPAKIFWSLVEYLGSLSAPPFLFLFALEYNCREYRLTKRLAALLFIVPAITFLLAATNSWHHLIWTAFTPSPAGQNLLIYGHGPAFWIGVIGYSYVMLAAAIFCFLRDLFTLPLKARCRTLALLIAIAIPWGGNLIYVAISSPFPALELTPLLMLITGSILAYIVFGLRLLDVVPLARTTLVDAMPDGMIVLDEAARILDANAAAQQIFQMEKVPYGEPIRRILPDWPMLQSLPDSSGRKQVEIAPGGLVKEFHELDIIPLTDWQGRQSGWLIVARNIEKKRSVNAAVRRRDAILQAVSLAAEKFLRLEAWEQSVPDVLAQIGQAAEVSRVYIFERHFREDGVTLVSQRYEWVAPGIEPQTGNSALQNFPYCSAGFARWDDEFLNHRPIFGRVDDLPDSEQALLASQGILSIAVMPIFFEESLWGFIGFDDCVRARAWSIAELEALRTAADIFGAALARSRAVAALRQRQRSLTLLHEIIHTALQASDLQQTAQALVDRLGELIGADGCFLTLWDEKTKRTIPLAAYGEFRETYSSIPVKPREKTLTASVLKAGDTLVIYDVMNSPYISRRLARQFPSRSMLAIPLTANGNKLGAILLPFDRQHEFTPEEIAISEQAAQLVALALAKVQAVEQATRRAEEAETLRKVGAAVTATLGIHEAVNLILDQLQLVVPHDSASVQLLRDGALEVVGGRGWPDPTTVVGLRFPVPGDNPNSIVIQKRAAYILEEADKVYPEFRHPPHNHIRSWLGVPLIVRQQVIGLLAIDSSHPRHFTAEHARLASAFADHVAIALENSRLFSEVQELALTDMLTGLYNRRGLLKFGQIEFARARRFQRPFAAILADIDHFKRINDRYGHTLGGDPVLKALAEQIHSNVREIDLLGRYGGEEFVVLLPETDLQSTCDVAERIRKAVEEMEVQTTKGNIRITISLGIAACDEHTPTLQILIARADQAMYVAKRKGRNRVAVSR